MQERKRWFFGAYFCQIGKRRKLPKEFPKMHIKCVMSLTFAINPVLLVEPSKKQQQNDTKNDCQYYGTGQISASIACLGRSTRIHPATTHKKFQISQNHFWLIHFEEKLKTQHCNTVLCKSHTASIQRVSHEIWGKRWRRALMWNFSHHKHIPFHLECRW